MDLGSARISVSPPIHSYVRYNCRCHRHRLPLTAPSFRAPRRGLHFPKSSVEVNPWNRKALVQLSCKSNESKVRCSQVEAEAEAEEEEGIGGDDEACELVNGTELTIADEGDGIQAYLFTAVKNNNATGILLLSDIFGFHDSATRDFAYRVACGGYNVLVPDLFIGDPWSKDRPTASLQEWIDKQRPERILETVLTSARWMIDEFESVGISKKLGIIGFCYGGGRVVDILAQDKGACFGCGVSFYGTRINTDAAKMVNVPLLMITGGNDELCPVRILKEITKKNKELKMAVFEGRAHGFAHRPETPEDDVDAEEAFALMRDWLAEGLLAKV